MTPEAETTKSSESYQIWLFYVYVHPLLWSVVEDAWTLIWARVAFAYLLTHHSGLSYLEDSGLGMMINLGQNWTR